MALKKAESTTPVGAFEDDTVVVAEAKAAPAASPQAQASSAIAKAQSSALVVAKKFSSVFTELRDALPAVKFGILPRLVGSNGQIMDKEKNKLGTEIVLSLLSWNKNYVVSPGDDTAEAKEFVRYSRDGVSIDDTGEDVKLYLEQLRADGYPKANKKEYIELVGVLESSDAKVAKHIDDIVQISLSPQGADTFTGYDMQRSMKVSQGKAPKEGSERLKITAEVKSYNSKDYTQLTVSGA